MLVTKSGMNSADVIHLYTTLEKLGVEVWIDGEGGVDALLGKQTRPHQDLDIAIEQKDVLRLRQFLHQRRVAGTLAGDSATCTSTNLAAVFSRSRFFHQ